MRRRNPLPRYRPSDPALWEAVRDECAEQWLASTGRGWTDAMAIAGTHSHEDEAMAAWMALRRVVNEARVTAASSGGGEPMLRLRHWLQDARHVLGRLDADPGWTVPDGRKRIAWLLGSVDVYDLGRPLTVREMAIVSLLSGNRPATKARSTTVRDVIAAEERAMRVACCRIDTDGTRNKTRCAQERAPRALLVVRDEDRDTDSLRP